MFFDPADWKVRATSFTGIIYTGIIYTGINYTGIIYTVLIRFPQLSGACCGSIF